MRQALLSLISPSVAVALIAAFGTYLTARAAFADVTLKRRLDTAKRFTELAEVANNVDGQKGLYEQISAVALLASFGRDEPHLRSAARAVLQQVQHLGAAQPAMATSKVAAAATTALATIPEHGRPVRRWRR